MCETIIDPSVLPFIAFVIRMAALLQVSAVFIRRFHTGRIWYCDVCLSVRPGLRQSQLSALFSYMV